MNQEYIKRVKINFNVLLYFTKHVSIMKSRHIENFPARKISERVKSPAPIFMGGGGGAGGTNPVGWPLGGGGGGGGIPEGREASVYCGTWKMSIWSTFSNSKISPLVS